MTDRNAIKQYQNINTQSGIIDSNPHQLITMLINGAVSRLSSAKGYMARRDFAGKGEQLGKSMDIISGLQSCLDMESGGEISSNLDALYDYMVRRLTEASMNNDMEIVDEVILLLREIKTGWDGITEEFDEIETQTRATAAV